MALSIFPRRRDSSLEESPPPSPAEEPPATQPEGAAEAPGPARPRRGSRGGRSRKRPEQTGPASTGQPVAAEAPAAPVRQRSRTPRPREAAAQSAEASQAPAPAEAPRRPPRRPAKTERPQEPATPAAPEMGDLARMIEQQGQQIASLTRAVEEATRRTAQAAVAPQARVGVFVDAANVELGCERQRFRLDWRKVLASLTEGRQLVRAVAYCPVHDDPAVSIDSQRFVEPFLGKGYRVVTKPLKRFADGTIKANIDIELTLDIVEMLDRLDVVVLASGDGDFERLVEVVQAKGVRVEVVSVGQSTAANLRNAADQFVDLATRTRDFRV